MYRLLRAHGESTERRRQRTHPAKKKPELMARRPNQVWSWDITKLKGPVKGCYYDLYVIIDIFSRYVVGWLVAPCESAELATDFIHDAVLTQGVDRDTLTIHADRGSSMRSRPVSALLVSLGVTRSHSRPHVSNDNPYSEAAFKTLKYCPAFPERFGSIETPSLLCGLLRSLQPRASPLGHRPTHPGVRALRHGHRDPTPAPAHAERAYAANPSASATGRPARRCCPRWRGSIHRSTTMERRRQGSSEAKVSQIA